MLNCPRPTSWPSPAAANGAFGSGILAGSTEAGGRPGAPGRDRRQHRSPHRSVAFSALSTIRNSVRSTPPSRPTISTVSAASSVASSATPSPTPRRCLALPISKYVDESLLAAIAREYQKGRLLLIGTTDLDAERANIWNVGAIAASGSPGALDLIRKILRASSAVPGFFQRVIIDVQSTANRTRNCMSMAAQFADVPYPRNIDINKVAHRFRTAYLIRNAREDPEWADVERQTLKHGRPRGFHDDSHQRLKRFATHLFRHET